MPIGGLEVVASEFPPVSAQKRVNKLDAAKRERRCRQK
jgi:hypothetical protein